MREGTITPVRIEGSKENWYVLSSDVPFLLTLEAGGVPDEWQPLGATTRDEVVFLAPLDIVSARGRANWLFDFEYIWEVYKPAAARRWGYYTLPILYDDRLVARLDPKLDRATSTLLINGFWLEEHAPVNDPAFAAALARGFERFMTFLGTLRLDISVIEPIALRLQVQDMLSQSAQK